MEIVIPNIAELHIRNITETLTCNESHEHGIPHISMTSVGNIEDFLPLVQ
jgi:hypothetical protein